MQTQTLQTKTLGNTPKISQEQKVLSVLESANGAWVNGKHFLFSMMLSQYHRAIHNLMHRDGFRIEASDFTDEWGYKSYRLLPSDKLFNI